MALLRRLFGHVAQKVAGASVAGIAADEGWMTALDMCGNNGQVSIIEMTGYDAFHEGALLWLEGGSPEEALYASCPHPDAVGEILDEAAYVIASAMEDMLSMGPGSGAMELNDW